MNQTREIHSRIPETLTHDGFRFQQIHRHGDVALSEKRKSNHRDSSFEVVRIQTHPAEVIFGKCYPEREAMPPAEAWGAHGWTYTRLEDALRKFQALAESSQEGPFPPADTPNGAFSGAGGSYTTGEDAQHASANTGRVKHEASSNTTVSDSSKWGNRRLHPIPESKDQTSQSDHDHGVLIGHGGDSQ